MSPHPSLSDTIGEVDIDYVKVANCANGIVLRSPA